MQRIRMRDTPITARVIGEWRWRYNWEPTWSVMSTYTNWSPGVAQCPFTTREACWDETHKGPPYSEGGPLNKWTSRYGAHLPVGSGTNYTTWGGDRQYCYSGEFVCAQTLDFFKSKFTYSGDFFNSPRSLVNGSNGWGDFSAQSARAWKKFQPGASVADGAVFLGELSDVPKMLRSTAQWFSREFISRFGRRPRGRVKVLADTWLNTQFGWLPFVSDLRKFYKAYRQMDEWYTRLVRNNGQWTKRRGTLFEGTNSELLESSAVNHLSYPDFGGHPAWYPGGNRGSYTITRLTGEKVWFEGQYRYYVPDIQSVAWRGKALAHLYGLDINPATLWELTPFSWLVDWCTNIGDLIANQSTGLISNVAWKYAYLMGHREEMVTVESRPNFPWQPKHVWYISLDRKTRKEANNFGFDLADSALTARQWSILAALGLSRAH